MRPSASSTWNPWLSQGEKPTRCVLMRTHQIAGFSVPDTFSRPGHSSNVLWVRFLDRRMFRAEPENIATFRADLTPIPASLRFLDLLLQHVMNMRQGDKLRTILKFVDLNPLLARLEL